MIERLLTKSNGKMSLKIRIHRDITGEITIDKL
jgi:hypothetical protein